MKHIALIGVMGAGKTSVARRAARACGASFVDMDKQVANLAGKSLTRIFAEDGEEVFRQLEHEALSALFASQVEQAEQQAAKETTGGKRDSRRKGRQLIISTGGGVVLREDNRKLLAEHAKSVWLNAPVGVLAERLANSPNPRPLLRGADVSEIEARLVKIMAERGHLYEELAEMSMDSSKMSLQEMAEAVANAAISLQLS